MSKSFVVMRGQGVYSDNTTRYAPVGGWMIGNSGSTVAQRERPVRDAGSFSNLYVYVSANTADVSSTVTLQKSQVDTAVTVSYTADQTGIKEDNSNSVSFAATDEADIEVTIPSDPQAETMTIEVVGLEFAPDTTTDCVSLLCAAAANVMDMSTDSVTRYLSPSGELVSVSATEANNKYRIRKACTAQDFYSYASANTRTTDCVLGTRKDGGAGGQSVTYTSTQTGAKEDTSGSDSLIAGSDYNYYITSSTGGNTLSLTLCSSSLVSTDNTFHMLAAVTGATVSQGQNVTNYFGVAGDLLESTTEANAQIYPRFTFTAKELQAYASANTFGSSSYVYIRDNGINSAVVVEYAGTQTGLKTDSTNSAEITSGTDEVNYMAVTPDVAGSITWRWMSSIGETTAATGQPIVKRFGGVPYMTPSAGRW